MRGAALAVASLLAAAPLAADEGFVAKVRVLRPGMSEADVIASLGEPEALLRQGADAAGRTYAVWRYLPSAPFSVTRTVSVAPSDDFPAAAEISLPAPASAGSGIAHARSRLESARRERLSMASGSVPPSQTAGEPAPPTPFLSPSRTRLPVYLLTFSEGMLQRVDFAEETLA